MYIVNIQPYVHRTLTREYVCVIFCFAHAALERTEENEVRRYLTHAGYCAILGHSTCDADTKCVSETAKLLDRYQCFIVA